MRKASSVISAILACVGLGIVVGIATKFVLHALVDALDGVDEIAQRQAARHAYGPLVATKVPDFVEQPDDNESATAAADPWANHRYAPGLRAWDDEVLDAIDPLNHTIDDPFERDGLIVQPPMHGTILRGGGTLETEI